MGSDPTTPEQCQRQQPTESEESSSTEDSSFRRAIRNIRVTGGIGSELTTSVETLGLSVVGGGMGPSACHLARISALDTESNIYLVAYGCKYCFVWLSYM